MRRSVVGLSVEDVLVVEKRDECHFPPAQAWEEKGLRLLGVLNKERNRYAGSALNPARMEVRNRRLIHPFSYSSIHLGPLNQQALSTRARGPYHHSLSRQVCTASAIQ